ncbi:MAG: type II secretion system ATPase GspE [Desulfuromonadales bacterium]|nr:type II secretion system ATPase GspE [Desulfuromonadales bacterium]
MSWQRFGDILRNDHGVATEAIDAALALQPEDKRRLGEILRDQGVINTTVQAQALATQFNLEFLPAIAVEDYAPELLDLLPIGFVRELRIVPLARHGEVIRLALTDPLDARATNDLATLTGLDVVPLVATPETISDAINRIYERHSGQASAVADEIGEANIDLAHSLEPKDLLDTADEAPIIRFVNSLITQAYKERASDIHIEPFETELVVRYRVDGILYEVLRPPFQARAGLISRIKIMSGLNIAEKRLPQDGRFRVRIAGKDVDVRVSTLPTAFGERIVLRLLDKSAGVLTLKDLGMGPAMLIATEAMIGKSHGIFLVTGPTGSGKTTTLYAALSRLNDREKNIITVEDPIEYQLAGVGQIQVNAKIDLTFANGLRSILRQDPDIIMVGEIRDGETAEIAVQSALTGHMVFSTLHTNDAAGALTRLVEMGVEPFLASSSIVGILAQRLVRCICLHCREAYQPGEELLRRIGLDPAAHRDTLFYRGAGCEKCMGIGYRGRNGIYELLTVSDPIRDLLLRNQDASSIRHAAIEGGMISLREAGIDKILSGETTVEEILRVTQEEG